jgi:uncharacterized protein
MYVRLDCHMRRGRSDQRGEKFERKVWAWYRAIRRQATIRLLGEDMRHRIQCLLVVLAIAIVSANPMPASAQTQTTQPPTEGIRVRGQGVIAAPPDVAVLSVGASVERPTAREAFTRANQLIAALLQSLRANGVLERDMQTQQYNLGPVMRRPPSNPANPNPPEELVGWRASQMLAVKLRDFDRIADTIDDAVMALEDASVVRGITFAIEDTNVLVARARAAAIQNARDRASELASEAGVQVGEIISLQEVSAPAPTTIRDTEPPAPSPAALAAVRPAEEGVSPGERTLSVVVEVVFAIRRPALP